MSRDFQADAEEAKNQGNTALAAKDFDAAIQWYTQALELSKRLPLPNNRHVYYSNRSAAYLSKSFAESALKDANECVLLRPDWAKGYTRRGAALHAQKKYDEAEKEYMDALEKFPGDAGLMSGLESVREDRDIARRGGGTMDDGMGGGMGGEGGEGNLAQLLWHPDSMEKLKSDPRTADLMKDAGFMKLFEMCRGRTDMLLTLMQSDERFAKVLSVLLGVEFGEPVSKEERAEAAKRREEEASKREAERKEREEKERRERETPEEKTKREAKERAEAHKERGNAHYKKREFAQALAEYDAAVKEVPTDMTYYLNRASVFLEEGKLEETLKACEEAIEIGRANQAPYEQIAKAFERRGNAYAKRNMLPEALVEYKRSQLECRSVGVAEKISKIERASKLQSDEDYKDPVKAAEAKEAGNAKFKAGDFAGAFADYTEAIKRDSKNAVYYVNRSAALTRLQDYGRAMEDAEEAIKLDARYPKAWARKGKIEQLAKKYHRAMNSYNTCLELDAGNEECLEGLKQIRRSIMTEDEETRKLRAARAMEDAEIRAILNDPSMQQVLKELGENPASSRTHLENPMIRTAIELLAAAGIIRLS